MSAIETSPTVQADAPAPIEGRPLLIAVVAAAFAILGCSFINHGLPVAVATAFGLFVPGRHRAGVRITLAIMGGLLALFAAVFWEGDADLSRFMPCPSILSWIIGLPAAGSIVLLAVPRRFECAQKVATLVVMLATFVTSLSLLSVPMGRGFHFDHDKVWIERFGIHYHVAVDGVSLWLVLLTTLIVPIATYASFGSIQTRIKEWCFALLALQAAMIGAFIALDLFLFYVFWELMLIPMVVMIGVWGGGNRIKAAIKFFLFTMFGSVLMLVAIFFLAKVYGEAAGKPSFDYFELQRLLIPRNIQIWLYAAFTLSFLIKVPMWPVHTWLPDAHTEAPTAGSVILAAVMLKLGTYGYLRFSVGLFPEASSEFAANLAGVAVVGGILYGALCAWQQNDIKKLVAYSSIAHLGYVMLGIFAASPASLEGSVLQMVNHGISTGMLFLLIGMIYDRRHTRLLDNFGGLAKVVPVYAALFVLASMASIGLPGTNGFVGEFMIIMGTFTSSRLGHFAGLQAVGAALGVILAAVYMLGAVQKMLFGRVTRVENEHLTDVNRRELVAIAPLVVLVFMIGLSPNLFLNQIRGAAARIGSDIQNRLEQNPGPNYYSGAIQMVPRRPEAPPLPPVPAQAVAATSGN